MADFVSNLRGVHLMHPGMGNEFTLCGDAFDAPDTEQGWEVGLFVPTDSKTVTCPKCVEIIRAV
jgi:hypothetical protein